MRRRQKLVRRTLLLVALSLVIAGIYAAKPLLTDNFHVAQPDTLLRSGQLDPKTLEDTVWKYHIASILNLRGAHPGRPWYDAEQKIAAKVNAEHFDLSLSANHEVNDAKFAELTNILRRAPKPILVHCDGGADRAGFACAVYLFSIEGSSAKEAKQQLGMQYGHVPDLWWRKSAAMDRSFQRVVERASCSEFGTAHCFYPNAPLVIGDLRSQKLPSDKFLRHALSSGDNFPRGLSKLF
jgi:protein tyrosine/serine phosphatase